MKRTTSEVFRMILGGRQAARDWAHWGSYCILFAFASTLSAQQQTLRGTVVDSTGSPLSNARIEFRATEGLRFTSTDQEGNFEIADVSGGTLLAEYPGFATATLEIRRGSPSSPLRIVLNPAAALQRIEVSAAGDDRVPPVPNGQFSIPRQEIEVSGSLALDDVLRQAPGFTLFRRSGSLFANPTSQGVSLRGLGANGASRAEVLLDGIPLNDPFGGWVYWNRIPRASVERVDVFNGGSSDLYGSGALGGVVSILSRPVRESFATVEVSYGNADTPELSLDVGLEAGKWGISAAGQALRTSGYIEVPQDQRGAVDTAAGTGDLAGSLEVTRKLREQGRFFLRASSFGEKRHNGTPFETNNTRIPAMDLGADWMSPAAGSFSLRIYGLREVFNQNFSSISMDRNAEALTDVQRSPSQQVGFVGQWQRTLSGKHTLAVGMEGQDVRGESAERSFNVAGPTADLDAGGRQRTLGLFVQDAYHFAPNWLFTFGGRADSWLNSRGFSSRTPLRGGAATANSFPERTEAAFSPRLALLHTFKTGVAVSASAYQAFRAPTLNELYRNFRVGNVVTNANSDLRAEKLAGGELGISLREWGERLTLRGNLFWSDVSNPVANVTLSVLPTLITRQRQNLGKTRARGVELAGEMRLPKQLRLSGGYILTDSRVVRFPANTAREGLLVPQVSRNQFTFQLSYAERNWMAGLQGRFVGKQFDDDLNALPLGRFITLDAEASRRLWPHARLFVAVENLTDTRYAIGRTPVLTLGPPLLARLGFRLDF